MVTARLVLRPFTDVDRAPFAELNAHPLVVESLGSSLSRDESDAVVDHIEAEMARDGWGLWAVEEAGGSGGAGRAGGAGGAGRAGGAGVGVPFVGMVGLHRVRAELPCAPAVEVEWRLHPDHWGRGYASEAASASLHYGFGTVGLEEIVAFTTTLNTRSQAVMERIGMERDPDRDFDHPRLPADSPLRRHVFYRARASQVAPTVGP